MADSKKVYISLENLQLYHSQVTQLIENSKVWVGTEAEYEAQKDTIADDRLVIITDQYDEQIENLTNQVNLLSESMGNLEVEGYSSVTEFIQEVNQRVDNIETGEDLVATDTDISRLFL